jgi:hypothetical protein
MSDVKLSTKASIAIKIVLAALWLGSLVGAYIYGTSTCPEILEIVDEEEGETDHLPPPSGDPNPCAWFEKCYRSDIKIVGALDSSRLGWFNVNAGDDCKKASKSFKLAIPSGLPKNELGIGPGLMIASFDKTIIPMIGGSIDYSRWWGNIGLGTRVSAYSSFDRSSFAAGADVSLKARW